MRVSISLLMLLAAQLPAQYLAGIIGPAPAIWPGQSLQLTLSATASCPGVRLDPQVVSSVHHGSPGGPVVETIPPAAGPAIDLQPFDTTTWHGPPWTHVLPGMYYLRVEWTVPTTGESGTEWYPIPQNPPALNLWVPNQLGAAYGALPIGETSIFAFAGFGCSGFPYFAAVSSSTNVGLPVPGAGHMVLDIGTPLWDLSWPNPHPALFPGFQGAMNNWGSGGFWITLPDLPQLVGLPVVLQVAAVPPPNLTGPLMLSNPLLLVVTQ